MPKPYLQMQNNFYFVQFILRDYSILDVWLKISETSRYVTTNSVDVKHVEALVCQDLDLLLSKAMVTTNPMSHYRNLASPHRYCLTITNPSWRRQYS